MYASRSATVIFCIASGDAMSNVERLKETVPQDIVLIVGHDVTVPAIIKALGSTVPDKIEPTEFDRLFQPFQRLHSAKDYDGTGIGLAMVYRTVQLHDGDIRVESAPGRGTTTRASRCRTTRTAWSRRTRGAQSAMACPGS